MHRFRSRLPLWAAAILVTVLGGVAVPAASASAAPVAHATAGKPTVTLIPAFSTDLPLSGAALRPTVRANGVQPLASWVCSIYASDPTKFANTIEGEGFQSCSGTGWSPQDVRVTLQKYKGLGFWNNLNRVESGWVYVNFVQRDFIYDCSGLGTQTYRVVTDGFAVGGAYSASVQSLNYLRVSC